MENRGISNNLQEKFAAQTPFNFFSNKRLFDVDHKSAKDAFEAAIKFLNSKENNKITSIVLFDESIISSSECKEVLKNNGLDYIEVNLRKLT